MDLSLIETCLNHLGNYSYWYLNSSGSADGYSGLVCTSSICFKTLSNTTGLTSLYSSMYSLKFGDTELVVDLSNNSNLTSISCSGWNFKTYLPKSITSVSADQSWPPIIASGTGKITSYSQCNTSVNNIDENNTIWQDFFTSLNNSTEITYLRLGRTTSTSFSLSLFSNCPNANIVGFEFGWGSASTHESVLTTLDRNIKIN